jgi:hypothetical protein
MSVHATLRIIIVCALCCTINNNVYGMDNQDAWITSKTIGFFVVGGVIGGAVVYRHMSSKHATEMRVLEKNKLVDRETITHLQEVNACLVNDKEAFITKQGQLELHNQTLTRRIKNLELELEAPFKSFSSSNSSDSE